MLKKNEKVIAENVKFCTNPLSKAVGLMFRKQIENEAWIFIFRKPKRIAITMVFVFFPIDLLFLDKEKKIVEIKKGLKPFTNYYPKKKAVYVVELPAGTIKSGKLKLGGKLKF